MKRVRVRDRVLLALLAVAHPISILEPVSSELDSQFGAELAPARATDSRPLLQVSGSVGAQVQALSDNVAELENISGDLARAYLLLLEELHRSFLIFTQTIPILLFDVECVRNCRPVSVRAFSAQLPVLGVEIHKEVSSIGGEQLVRLRSGVYAPIATLAQLILVLLKPVVHCQRTAFAHHS